MQTMTLGQQAADALKTAKTAAQSQGKTLSWDEVAAIIDGCAAPATKTGDKIDHTAYGDKKKIPPTPEQVTAYSAAIGYPMNGQAWCDCYAQKGWKVGAKKMVDWQAAVRNWKTNDYAKGGIAMAGAKAAGVARDYSQL